MTQTVSQIVKRQRTAGAIGFLASGLLIALSLGLGFGPKEVDSFTVRFDIGTTLQEGGTATIDAAVASLATDPTAVLVVTGHTGTAGDMSANHTLSENRAQAVADLIQMHGVSEDRIVTLGAAGTLPAPREDGMSDAAYERTLPRAVITLSDRSLFPKPQG